MHSLYSLREAVEKSLYRTRILKTPGNGLRILEDCSTLSQKERSFDFNFLMVKRVD